MRKRISTILMAVLLLISSCIGTPGAYAATKPEKSRTIAIVFDNSGTMYMGDEDSRKTWCRATYAMQVLATMMNPSDTMLIYPMNPIQIGNERKVDESDIYTKERPLVITNANASLIQEIFTPNAGDTHIETVTLAREGAVNAKSDEKWLIVLTDGTVFYRDGKKLSKEDSIKQLTEEFVTSVDQVNAMYLGIGKDSQSGFDVQGKYQFIERKATNSAQVLANLTELGNIIFGRDVLPSPSKRISFDVSMKKLILFVQGEAIDNVQLGQLTPLSTSKLQYSTYGARNYSDRMLCDTTLQGTMLTFENVDAGSYNISFSGDASDIAVYYEPDVDLDFVFTNADGSAVDTAALYADEYKVGFGMKDAKTGELTSSTLLGNPHYSGNYYINDEAFPISHDGLSGEIPVTLNVDDSFEATLTVTYLSGYTITKNTADFGWPQGGIRVVLRPAGNLRIEISGGDEVYSLKTLEDGTPYTAKVYYQDELLTGSELERVELKWEPDTSNAEIKKLFAEDHWELSLHYKDPEFPQDTVCGECTVNIYAFYTERTSGAATAQTTLTYNIDEDLSTLQMKLVAPQTDILVKELESSKPIEVQLLLNEAPLTAADFETLQLQVDTGGIEYEVTKDEQNSACFIKLLPTEEIEEGSYTISVTAQYTDPINRICKAEGTVKCSLSTMPAWMKMMLRLAALLVLAVITWTIMHIKVLPTHAHTTRKLSTMTFDGDVVSEGANFMAEIKKRGAKVQAQYTGAKFGISMDVTPGKESYLYKPAKRRSVVVKATSVKKFGTAKIQEVLIGSVKYVTDEATGRLVPAIPNQKPFPLTNGVMVKFSGTMQDAGVDKDFLVTSKLNFVKKK